MSTERRGARSYYYRARKVRGRVLKQYVGPSDDTLATLAAARDAEASRQRQHLREMEERQRQSWAELIRSAEEIANQATATFREAMQALGYRSRYPSEWRKPRGPRQP
jgi:hypothetical protein